MSDPVTLMECSKRVRIRSLGFATYVCLLQGSRTSGNAVLSFKIFPVLKIHDVYPGFQILTFFRPGSRTTTKIGTEEEKKMFLYGTFL
jgi:hypothetical protein